MPTTANKLKELYEVDGHDWYFKNAQLIREGKLSEIDVENVAEELESMGRGEEDKLESFLTQLFLHLLKWKYQPARRGSSWEISIKKQRVHARRHMKRNPSLKGCLEEVVRDSYEDAKLEAAQETGLLLEAFPEQIPFTLEQALTEGWLPE